VVQYSGVFDALSYRPVENYVNFDLGSAAKEVEQALDLNFNLATRLGCLKML
jgi:hypothetical protein